MRRILIVGDEAVVAKTSFMRNIGEENEEGVYRLVWIERGANGMSEKVSEFELVEMREE